MALPRARKDSNAPKGDADFEPSTGEVAMVGFTHVPYEKFRPATSNADVPTSINNSKSEIGNDGTSVGAYKFQPKELNSETFSEMSIASKNQEK